MFVKQISFYRIAFLRATSIGLLISGPFGLNESDFKQRLADIKLNSGSVVIGQKKSLHRREFSCYVSVSVSRDANVLGLLPMGLPDMIASKVSSEPA
jgi:hypothetical protein